MNGFDLSTVSRIRLGGATVRAVYYGSTKIWPHDYSQDYLTFEALEAGTFTWTDTTNNNSISYSIDDGSTWTTLTSGSYTRPIAANSKVIFKASGLTVSNLYGIGRFSSSGRFNVMGNIQSLVDGDNFTNQTTVNNDWQFCGLFFNCTNLVDASNLILPAGHLLTGYYSSMFDKCTSLTTAPELPSTTLERQCYNMMFSGCSSLTTAPVLSATTLAEACYAGMFAGCTSLTTAPVLPATTLTRRCYDGMFNGCSSLTTAPALPATTLAEICYVAMFAYCTSLTTAPALPATTLAESCYGGMFIGCTALTTAPELPATTLARACYTQMFQGCSSLTTAPELPATTLTEECYYQMFYGCSSLNYIKCLATDISASLCTSSWVNGVSNNGTFVRAANNTSWTIGDSGIPTGWTVDPPLAHDYSQDYLTFEALGAGTFTWKDTRSNNSISYSIDDGSTWTTLTSGSSTPTINANSKVIFKASGLPVGRPTASSYSGIGTFSSSGRFNVMGNIMSLVDGDNFASSTTLSNNGQLARLFYQCANLVDASNLILPATTLASDCYREMFVSCTSLTTAPELPATTLANKCYYNMFNGCTALTTAPELPATTLAQSCYGDMFRECTALTIAPELPATTLANSCYASMFSRCTALTTAPELPATTLATGCYGSMLQGCTALTTAPELPATTLANSCYYKMFQGCSSLNYIKCLATDISATGCTSNWVRTVSNNGTFVKAASMTDWTTGTSGIPSGWTVQDAT